MQQINLFKQIPVVEVKKQLLKDNHLMVIIALIWIGMVVLIIESFWARSVVDKSVTQLQIDQKVAQTKLQELTAKYPEAAKVSLEQKSKEIEQKIAAKQTLVNLLNQAAGTNGYSKRLKALSDLITPDTWLTGIMFDDSTSYVGMAGDGLSSDGIFRFVDNLGGSTAFSDVKFQTFKVIGTETQGLLKFVLSSEIGRLPATIEDESKTKKKTKRAPNAEQ